MDRSSATLLEFVARLTYNVDGLSGKLRLYFSQFLTFHFSKTLSLNQIQDIENSKASKPLKGEREIVGAASGLTENEKCWAIAAIELLRAEAERLDDRVLSRRLAGLTNELIQILGLTGSMNLIDSQRNFIEEEIRNYEERPIVRIPAAIWPLSLDFMLRCAALLYVSIEGIGVAILSPINIPLIPVIVLGVVIFYRRRNKKANIQLLENYGGIDRYKAEFHMSASQYTWLALYLIASTFISYLLAGTDNLSESLHIAAFVSMVIYYSVYLLFLNVGKIKENDLVRQLDEKELRTDTLDVDENDEMIVSLETRLNASTSRLDAYVLESALFGALTFSGFLQIMASDLVSFKDLEAFASNVFTTSRAFIHLDGTAFKAGLGLLNDKVSLFCLVSVESLICSIFFVAVIASRLRFSDIADRVRTAINLARAFNEKEEALYHESETSDVRHSRLLGLTAKVNRQIFEAGQSLRKIDPVMAYMQYFRNAGILVFVIILISSSLFITSSLGWTFLAAVIATYFYFNRERISLNFRATFLQLRILFLRWSVWLFVAAISPFVISMILRICLFKVDTELDALGYLLVGLFVPIWLLLASHFDQEFGDIEKKENRRRASRWNLVRNILAAMIFVYCVGMCLKLLHWGGADELIFIGISVTTILMFFAGYYLSKIKWLGLISGLLLGMSSVALMLKTFHLDYADEMLRIAVIGLPVFCVVIILRRKAFHSLFLRFCLVLTFLTFTLGTNAIRRLELAYTHRTTDLAQFFRLFSTARDGDFTSEARAIAAVEPTESYIATFGNKVPYHLVYQDLLRIYDNIGKEAVTKYRNEPPHDTEILKGALVAVKERDKILELYNYPGSGMMSVDVVLKADILLLLNRKDEAEVYLNSLLSKMRYGPRNEILEKLASIQAL